MPENLAPPSPETERAELDAVAEALARSPRLSRLVRYLGDKYFQGESDQLHEYNIASEVFVRSKTVFDAGEDAIARVEAHRLRKRLKEFYETEGKNHPVHLSIPPALTFQYARTGLSRFSQLLPALRWKASSSVRIFSLHPKLRSRQTPGRMEAQDFWFG
jgi:hypothetical protein